MQWCLSKCIRFIVAYIFNSMCLCVCENLATKFLNSIQETNSGVYYNNKVKTFVFSIAQIQVTSTKNRQF